MARVNWTKEAQLWLRDIFDYIAVDNPVAASSEVLGIHTAAQLLRDNPRLGQRYMHVTDREVRILIHGHYRIGYLIREESEDVDILGVFHGALPIERYLF